ncbi:Hypothetical protein HVR_LOCUS438 [uncultured virus]|nr:Hypothetical protein HVR_LOCUS438 [uncultured virus]
MEQLKYAIAVSDLVYNSLMKRFDEGEQAVYTGRPDGTNRRVYRTNGIIHSDDGREVISLSKVQSLSLSGEIEALNPYAKFCLDHQHHKTKWIYKNHKSHGIKCVQCEIILLRENF